jgi:hypothetical protein
MRRQKKGYAKADTALDYHQLYNDRVCASRKRSVEEPPARSWLYPEWNRSSVGAHSESATGWEDICPRAGLRSTVPELGLDTGLIELYRRRGPTVSEARPSSLHEGSP